MRWQQRWWRRRCRAARSDQEQTGDHHALERLTDRELGVIGKVADKFHASHTWITVKSVGGQDDDKIVKAIRGGNAPEVTISFSADRLGSYCSSGAWIDLGPYLKRDNVDVATFPKLRVLQHGLCLGHARRAVRHRAGRHHLACIDRDGAHPLPREPLEPFLLGLVQHVAAYERLAVTAARSRTEVDVRRALLAHPLVGQWDMPRALPGLLDIARQDVARHDAVNIDLGRNSER